MWRERSAMPPVGRVSRTLQEEVLDVLPELKDPNTLMRYYRVLNDRNRTDVINYWSQALPKFFNCVHKQASIKFGALLKAFFIDNYHLTSLGEILEALSHKGEVLLLESVESEGEYKKVNLSPAKPPSSFLGSLKKLVFGGSNDNTDKDPASLLSKDHFVVFPPLLEDIMQPYVITEAALIRQQLYEDDYFKSKPEVIEFFEMRNHSVHDAYLIVHQLVLRKLKTHLFSI